MIASVVEIVQALRDGQMVVLIDDEDRENEGDLLIAAQHVTPDVVNFMATHGRGLICLTLTEERCRQLSLSPMVQNNRARHSTAFTASIEAAEGVSTGISAHDRAHTIQVAVASQARPSDLVQPGHIFPLIARRGGVLMRAGHTEAGCDLARLAGLEPAAVICEILNEDGTMARLPDLEIFAKTHGLKIGAIADLIEYRSRTECLVARLASQPVATAYGEFTLVTFRDNVDGILHFAYVKGDPVPNQESLVRVHTPLSIVDFLNPQDVRHTVSIQQSLAHIAEKGVGVLVLLRRPQSEEELLGALLPETVPVVAASWDSRLYGLGAQILRQLGVGKMRLLGSARPLSSMGGFGLEVVE